MSASLLSLRGGTRLLLGLFLVVAIAVVALWMLYQNAQGELQEAYQTRYDSYLLADELRQSSDDLTGLARSYVATGETRFSDIYWNVLAIRNGEKPRPESYNRIYWDFVAAGQPQPRPGTERVSLRELMREAGFTQAEFSKLDDAQRNSDGLVALETAAMNAVQGRFQDAQGAFTVTGEPDLEKARALMFGDDYFRFKAEIMQPIDAFFVLLDHRTARAVAEAQDRVGTYGWLFGAAMTVLLAQVCLAAWAMSRRVLAPLGRLRGSMLALSDGQLDREVPEAWRRDEVGEMAGAVQVFKDSMREHQRLQAEQLEIQSTAATRGRRLDELAAAFETAVEAALAGLGRSTSVLQDTAHSMSSVADQTRSQTSSVASASTQASANVQTVATAAEELSSSIHEISRQVQQSASMSDGAVTQAGETRQTVQRLAQVAEGIGEVVSLISDIAAQTNLLALNATIEAARAGEAGKGFAVVASEVKNLATQTARATEDISRKIGEIQSATGSAVGAIERIAEAVDGLNGIAGSIAAAVEEQSAATGEIARNVQQAASGTEEVNRTVGGLNRNADATGDAAGEVLSAVEGLGGHTRSLQDEVAHFLTGVKAA